MGFNLEDYETVESRIDKFYTIHGDGAIFTKLLSDPNSIDTVVVQAYIFISGEPVATGLASETKGEGYVNKTAWLENAETSAIGRALANYNLSGAKRPSREEMEKVERGEKGSTSPPMPTERADGPGDGAERLFKTIVAAANAGKFGDAAATVMEGASLAKKEKNIAHLEGIVEVYGLADA